MRAVDLVVGAILFAAGFAAGFVTDHFTTWVGPRPGGRELLAAFVILLLVVQIVTSWAVDRLERREGIR